MDKDAILYILEIILWLFVIWLFHVCFYRYLVYMYGKKFGLFLFRFCLLLGMINLPIVIFLDWDIFSEIFNDIFNN